MGWRFSLAFVLCVSALGTGLIPERARACGGCFTVTGSPTVVTAHRMAMAISPVQSTLWDQFSYSGAPEDFVWVLPASADSTVEIADNRFFEVLESRTDVQLSARIVRPTTSCPSRSCGGSSFDAATRDMAAPPDPPVIVHHEGTVGPYETVTISSDDPMALVAWLQEHGYGAPDALVPTIQHYSEMGMAFIALRLRPDEAVQRMQPVRVTMPGLAYVLPLRMIAAGVADKVGLRLFVFADARYDAQSFPNATIDPAEVAYDWATGGFTYEALLAEALASNGGRAWVTTYSGRIPVALGEQVMGDSGRFDVDDDLVVARAGLDAPVMTRLEASLGVAALDRDLVLGLAADQSGVANVINVTNDLNRPADVVCAPRAPCDPEPSDPGDDRVPSGMDCAASPGLESPNARTSSRALLLGIAAIAIGIALARRRGSRTPR